MPFSRDDTLKKLEIFSGFFYACIVGYKINSGDEESATVKWLETSALLILTTVKMVDNYFKMKDRRERIRAANSELAEQRDQLLRDDIRLNRLALRVELNESLLEALLEYHLSSNLINLALTTLTSSSILGIWINNALLSYCSAGVGFVTQSIFSYFQSHKSTQFTDSAFNHYNNELHRLDAL